MKIKPILGSQMTGEEYIENIMEQIFLEKRIVISKLLITEGELQPYLKHHLRRCNSGYLNGLLVDMQLRVEDILKSTVLENVLLEEMWESGDDEYSNMDNIQFIENKTIEFQIFIFSKEIHQILREKGGGKVYI